MSDEVEENTVGVLKKQLLRQRCLYLMLYMSGIEKDYDGEKKPFKESHERNYTIVSGYIKKINNLIYETKVNIETLRPLSGCHNCCKLDYEFLRKTYYHVATKIMETVDG